MVSAVLLDAGGCLFELLAQGVICFVCFVIGIRGMHGLTVDKKGDDSSK